MKKEEKLQNAKEYAISRGGLCLSEQYVNNKTPLEWKCHNNEHASWFSNSDNIINKNTWCLQCSGKAKKLSEVGLQDAKQYAHSRNGMCLSGSYESDRDNLEWKCHNTEHSSWFASCDNVLRKKTWCKACADQKQTEKKDNQGLKKCQDYAHSKGGLCISEEYINQNTNVEWKCHNPQHSSWLALPKIATKGSWCKECYNEKRKQKSTA